MSQVDYLTLQEAPAVSYLSVTGQYDGPVDYLTLQEAPAVSYLSVTGQYDGPG
jgi:hypothetical protein